MKTMNQEHKALPSNRFRFNPRTRVLSAEMSNFGPCRDGMWWMVRLYPDAADVGIYVRSDRTGRVEPFFLEREEKDAEGDLLALHFRPVSARTGVKNVVIFND